ncbi:MAG: glycine betaine/L-proline ABC transporter ATP-binding protein [Dehalococcoidia bacterium]|nr:glycine betaine/L-proline ABC transporter ATP-binding protein [Dehalococcoidia bacterium]
MGVMTQSEHQIEVKNVWKVFGNRPERALDSKHAEKTRTEIQEELGLVTALRDVSFNVDFGQVYVLMGLSGSGKSTLARALIRLTDPTAGEVYFDGEDILQFSPDRLIDFRRSTVAMVFQNYALLPHRRVLENVAYGLEVKGMEKEERLDIARDTVEKVGLNGWERYFPREMSGGMQQRVGLARALAVNPSVLIMDEPFSGLDPLIRRQMQDELLTLQADLHKTIVFITHDLNEAIKLGTRIAIMRDGEIIQEGTPDEIVALPSDDYVSEFVRDVSSTRLIQARTVMSEAGDVVNLRQGPGAALILMENMGSDSLFVVGGDSRLKGMLTKQEAESLANRRQKTLEEARLQDPVIVDPDTSLDEIIPIVEGAPFHVAVVEENGVLVGAIRRDELLSGGVGIGDNSG